MKYDVHILAVHRDKFYGIEAVSQIEAIEKAQEMFDMDGISRPAPGVTVEHCGYNEEISGYLVDECGDEEFQNSRFYEPDGATPAVDDRVKLAAPDLLQSLRDLVHACEFWEDQHDPVLANARAAIAKAAGLATADISTTN